MGNIDGVRKPGPTELELEVLIQNLCLRMGRGGFPEEFWVCVTRRREVDIKQQMAAQYGFREGHYMDLGLGDRGFREKDQDTKSSYYPVYCILWISFPLVGGLLCVAFSFLLL